MKKQNITQYTKIPQHFLSISGTKNFSNTYIVLLEIFIPIQITQ